MKINKPILIFFFLMASWLSHAQKSVSGTVTDDAGMPVPGATVAIKTSKTAVVTDFDGNYRIDAADNAVLVYSFVGYRTVEMDVSGRTIINVKLAADTQAIDEVVVVGYGTQKRANITGSISSVKAKDLEGLPITRIEQSLQGRTSGLLITSNSGQPGSSASVRIRGYNGFGNNDPLWIVDGIFVDNGGVGVLNQSDIQSIEVLKDAASAAIYGTRAANGVIIITTKKGAEGKFKVSYTGFAGVSSPARKLDLLNATEYATLRNESLVAAGNAPRYANPAALGAGTDWQSLIFNNNAHRESHEVSVSGGNGKSNYYMSVGYLDQEGIVSTDISRYTRKNFRLNSNHEIAPWLRVGQTFGYSNEKNVGLGNVNNEYGGPLSSAINLDPVTPAVVTDPAVLAQSPYNDPNNVYLTDQYGHPYGISTVVAQEITNPLAYQLTKKGNYGWSDNLLGNVFVELEPIKGLKFRSTFNGKMAFWGYDSYTPQSYLNASTITLKNNISRGMNRGFGWNIDNTLSYTRSFGNHNVTALIGQGAYVDNLSKGSTVTVFNIPATSFYDAYFPSSGNIAADDKDYSAYESIEHKISSLFARVNYDYKEKYLLTGIIRRDGSSRFGVNHKYGTFPSLSLGWVVSKENFWKENKYVNSVKLRGGYGKVGNDQFADFAFLSTISGGRNYTFGSANQGNVVVGYSPNAPSNPDLKWESTTQTDAAIEMTLMNNLNFNFTVWKKETNDLLRAKPIPGYVGAIGSPYANIGKMENKGFDIELGYHKRFGEFDFGLSGNASYIRNKVVYIDEATKFLDGDGFQTLGSIVRIQPGHAYGEFYGYETLGVFQTQAQVDGYVNGQGDKIQPNAQPGDFIFKDNNGDGRINEQDRAFIGNPTPDWIYGVTLNLAYKGFDLTAFGQGVAGNQIFQGLRRLDIAGANYQTEALNRWTGPGTTNEYPRLVDGDPNGNFSKMSKFYLQDGDYFRVKLVQLGYTIPKSVTQKAAIEKVRLFATGENLFTFTKYTGYDPEVGGGTISIDRGQYPQARSYMLGINLEF